MLSEISQTQKGKHHIFSLSYVEAKESQPECRIVISRGWGGWRAWVNEGRLDLISTFCAHTSMEITLKSINVWK